MAQTHSPPFQLSVGDPMPRVLLPVASDGTYDSWDQTNAGRIQIYWLDPATASQALEVLGGLLAEREVELRVVAPQAPSAPAGALVWLIDKGEDLRRAVRARGPAAIVVDAGGQLAAVVPPVAAEVAAIASGLLRQSEPAVVRTHAPVLLIENVLDADLCGRLIEHWRKGDKLADGVASAAGASLAQTDVKRRHDVPVDDKRLFGELRDGLIRRVLPAIMRAFQARVVQIELPRIGCYDAGSGGWFRRHRDNTTPFTAHRQFALTLNLNSPDEYEGGELRFPEFGRQLYRPPAGGAVVFSCSLLHEVAPMRAGRRFGLFTFLHDESREPMYRRMLEEQKARGLSPIQMR